MKQAFFLYIILLLVLFSSSLKAEDVRVAVASNFLVTLKAIKVAYEAEKRNDSIVIISGSTGKLYSQIMRDAPYDILLSADARHTEKLVAKGKAVTGSRFVYAQGQLVLWGKAFNKSMTLDAIPGLLEVRFAMANPRTAPYGLAASQVLKRFDLPKLSSKSIIRGENINQVFQFLATGNVSVGFVALSQVLNPNNPYNRTNYWHIPATYYEPLLQEAALLTYGKDKPPAVNFLQYLKGKKARQIMARYGYL